MHNDGKMKRLCSCIIKAHSSLSIAHLFKRKHLKRLYCRRRKLLLWKTELLSEQKKVCNHLVAERFYAQSFMSSIKSCFVQLLFRWLLLQHFPLRSFLLSSFFSSRFFFVFLTWHIFPLTRTTQSHTTAEDDFIFPRGSDEKQSEWKKIFAVCIIFFCCFDCCWFFFDIFFLFLPLIDNFFRSLLMYITK